MKWSAIGMVAAAVAAALALTSANAQPQGQERPERSTLLSINSSGESEAPPDMATMTLGVQTQGATARTAMADNGRRMTALVQALRDSGVAERDVQTSGIWVYPRQEWRDGSVHIVGYQANNSVRVRVRGVEHVAAVVDAAVAVGGNTVSGIAFSHQDEDAQLDAARRAAITEARRRADLYAGALGLRVQRVVSVSEAGAAPPEEAILVTGTRLARQGFESQTPVAPGEIVTRANVSVSFELS